MNLEKLFLDHLNLRKNYADQLLEELGYDSLIIDTGMTQYYFQDDRPVPFKPNPHFIHHCPNTEPGHIIQLKKGEKPKLLFFQPDDFWHEVETFDSPYWAQGFDIQVISKAEKLWSSLDLANGKHCCISPTPQMAVENSVELAPDSLISALHWSRIQKSEYEIYCIQKANEIAAKGHLRAKEAFFAGKSEKQIFQEYVDAVELLDNELPYRNIVAFNEKAAILHYQKTRTIKNGQTFLIDAGATFNGYCSDITRTYFQEEVHPIFKNLHSGLDAIQKSLCGNVLPGKDYLELHKEAHREIGHLLLDLDIFQNTSLQEIEELELTKPFFPHGLGHSLGIQVHDVGGKQLDAQGTASKPDKKHPYLRTLREIQENDVLTIEPGTYFIPLLLKDFKENLKLKDKFNWKLIEKMVPLGGIRIEDNVVAKKGGSQNLTRPVLPN